MALMKCAECGKEISTAAVACPACGAPPPKRTSRATKLAAALLGIVALIVVFSMNDKAPTPGGPVSTQHLAKGRAIELCERYVKSVARHPSTVEFSRVIDLGFVEHPNGRTTVRSKFTARNSFNLETTHDVRCLLDKNGLIEGNFHESR